MSEILSTLKKLSTSLVLIYWSIFFLVSFLIIASITNSYWLIPYISLLPPYLFQLISFLEKLASNFLLPLGSIAILLSLLVQVAYEFLRGQKWFACLSDIGSVSAYQSKKPSIYYYLGSYYSFGKQLCFIFSLFTLLFKTINPETLNLDSLGQTEGIYAFYSIYKFSIVTLTILYSFYFVLIKHQKLKYAERFSTPR